MERELIKIDKKVEEETNIVVTKATEIAVSDKESCDTALAMGKTVNDLRKQINDYFSPVVKAAHEAHKAIKSKQNEAIAPLDKAKAILSGKVNAYNIELKRKQREEEERIRKEAEAAAEEERKKLEAEAEKAAEKGDEEAFDKANYEAAQVTPETVMPVSQPKEKVKGSSENWQFRVVDKHALIKAALEGNGLDQAVIPNEKWLGQMAKTTKGQMKIPGVVFEDIGTVRF